jgi:hypothetical protein
MCFRTYASPPEGTPPKTEEAAGLDGAPVRQASLAEQRGRPVDDVRLVEDDAAQAGMRLEQGRQEGAVPAADVDDRAEAAEVVGLEHGRDRPVRRGLHRPVEGGALVGPPGAVRPRVDAVDVPERVLAGAHRVQ